MADFSLSVANLFDGKVFKKNQTIKVNNGLITAISDEHSTDSNQQSGTLIPGYIDIQVNGGGGVLFNQSPSLESLKTIAKAHQQFGTTGWLPTLVTDSLSKMQLAADSVAKARQEKHLGILGIHFEGPHLSEVKRGIHKKSFIRALSGEEIKLFCRKDLGKVVVTLAPEVVSPEQINELVSKGVIVCLGHSNASFEQVNIALKAGASGFTHLFNAMSPFTSREPGMVGAALLDKNSYAGLILDGIHVHTSSAKLAIKTKSNIMLVTDAMPPVGSSEECFEFFGQSIRREGNRLTDKQGRLAGSVLDMAAAVNNGIKMLGLSFEESVCMATRNPAHFLGLSLGSIEVGATANMNLVDANNKIIKVWVNGESV